MLPEAFFFFGVAFSLPANVAFSPRRPWRFAPCGAFSSLIGADVGVTTVWEERRRDDGVAGRTSGEEARRRTSGEERSGGGREECPAEDGEEDERGTGGGRGGGQEGDRAEDRRIFPPRWRGEEREEDE